MNVRDVLIPAALTFATVFIVNHFLTSRQQEASDILQPGQSAMAPEDPEYYKPVQTHIDFDDDTLNGERTQKDIETPLGSYQLSNATGSIASLQFTHPTYQDTLIETLSVTENAWEQYAFLIATDEQTPYYYSLISHEDRDNVARITYAGASSRARITKTYEIDKDTHAIDLKLEVEPLTEDGCVPRIFLPAPHMDALHEHNATHLIAYESGSLAKYASKDLESRRFWREPALFGGENRYFIHALIRDNDNFVQRAYARLGGQHSITPIFEGARITQPHTWRLSFYCGPKEDQAINAVDDRLEEALDYGMLAPVSKVMLRILKWMYAYIGNYGWAIIILTIIMRLLLLPFTARTESPSHAKSQEYARKKKALEQKYQNDQETLMREQYRLAKEYGMMPSMLGCLPMLLQIPVFIGLNYVLRSSIVLYKAPFIGWIHDLSAPDPYYILPVLIGGALFVNAMTSQQRQQQMVFGLLSVFLIGVTANVSAGLALYIAASSILAVAQTALVKKVRS